jgi:hypothetical protein
MGETGIDRAHKERRRGRLREPLASVLVLGNAIH